MTSKLVNPILSINRGKRFKTASGNSCFYCSSSLPEKRLVSSNANKPVHCCEICHVITNIDLYKSGDFGTLVLTPRMSQLSLIEITKFQELFTNPKVQKASVLPEDISNILITIDQHLISASKLVNVIAEQIKSTDNFADALSSMNVEEYEMSRSALKYINLWPNLKNPFYKNLIYREQKKYIPSIINKNFISKLKDFSDELVSSEND